MLHRLLIIYKEDNMDLMKIYDRNTNLNENCLVFVNKTP